MAELEKVILGIENCITTDSVTECRKTECPFIACRESCLEWLLRSALALLQAQEPRVMNAEELRQYLMVNENGLLSHDQWQELGQRAPLYIEFRRPDEYQVNWRTAEHLRPWAMEPMFWDSYGKDRRCWTARPSEEQRRETPWSAVVDDYDEHRYSGLLSED